MGGVRPREKERCRIRRRTLMFLSIKAVRITASAPIQM